VDWPEVDPAEMRLSIERMACRARIQAEAAAFPDWSYVPSAPSPKCPYANQRGFHASTHIVRVMVPGNGWGKTTAMGAEANWWGLHEHPYQETPRWPVLMLWFAKLSDQFELVKERMREQIIGESAQWRVSDGEFRWPDGSRLVLGLADDPQAWQKWQGVPVDCVFFDEQPPVGLWREMAMRRRAQRKTRFVFGATATGGASWMEDEFWKPWAEHHRAKGLTVEEGLWEQSHPDYWVWDRGGIADNPAADEGDVQWYSRRVWSSEAERKVRLHGGFGRFSGNPVFDHAGIDQQLGWLDNPADPAPERRSVWIVGEDEMGRRWSVLEHDVEKVREWPFALEAGRDPSGRLDVWEEPEDGLVYVIGGDCAYGLKDRDFDTAIVLAKGKGPIRQVAEACGHWGERFDRVVYALARYYSDAFVCLERQVGLPIMRRLYRDFGYRHLYYERDETKRGRDVLDSLGHPRTHDDFTMRNLRRAIADGSLVMRSRETLEQMRSLEFYSPKEDADKGSRVRDQELKIRLPGGGSPDLVMGTAYAWLAAGEVSKFEEKKPKYGPGTYGAVLGHEEAERRREEGNKPRGLGWRAGR
jgi:phage terminase large subunit-like protein